MDKRITVVLADANEEFRTALKQALEATGEFDVVGCAADGLAAAQDIAERKPRLLVMDLLLPGLDGFGVLEQAAKDKVQMKTVVVSALYRDQIVSQATETLPHVKVTRPYFGSSILASYTSFFKSSSID